MAKAVVKSFQEIGNLALRLKSSRMSMSKEIIRQKHQVNMHQTQREKVVWNAAPAIQAVIRLKITSSIRTMPTGAVSVFKSTAMAVVILLSI